MSRFKKGFTLMELLVVVAIIAILVVIIVPVVSGSIAKAKDSVCLSNRRALYSQVMIAYLSQTYNSCEDAFDALYDSSVYVCPYGGEFSWSGIGEGGEIHCSHTQAADSEPSEETSADPGGGAGNEPTSEPEDVGGAVTFRSANGTKYVIMPSPGVEERIANVSDIRGYVFFDETGACLVTSWTWAFGNQIKNYTVVELTEEYPSMAVLLNDKNFVSQSELDANPSQPAGTVCQYNGVYYYTSSPSSINNMPSSQSMWLAIVQ